MQKRDKICHLLSAYGSLFPQRQGQTFQKGHAEERNSVQSYYELFSQIMT